MQATKFNYSHNDGGQPETIIPSADFTNAFLPMHNSPRETPLATVGCPSTCRETPFYYAKIHPIPFRYTHFSLGETPFYYGERPLVLKTAFVALCFLLDGGIPRCGGVKNASPAANWAQKRVTRRVPSLSAAFARAFRTAKSKVQSSAGAFPCGNGTVSFSVFLFLPSLFFRLHPWLNIQPPVPMRLDLCERQPNANRSSQGISINWGDTLLFWGDTLGK